MMDYVSEADLVWWKWCSGPRGGPGHYEERSEFRPARSKADGLQGVCREHQRERDRDRLAAGKGISNGTVFDDGACVWGGMRHESIEAAWTAATLNRSEGIFRRCGQLVTKKGRKHTNATTKSYEKSGVRVNTADFPNVPALARYLREQAVRQGLDPVHIMRLGRKMRVHRPGDVGDYERGRVVWLPSKYDVRNNVYQVHVADVVRLREQGFTFKQIGLMRGIPARVASAVFKKAKIESMAAAVTLGFGLSQDNA